MRQWLILSSLLLTLSSCAYFQPHHLTIEQGNLYTEQTLQRLKLGMTTAEVKDILGNPLLVNIFADNRLEYVYTLQKGGEAMHGKRVTCIFNQNRLRQINAETL